MDVDPDWDRLADSIAQLCLKHFTDGQSGVLREFFDDAGNPVSGAAGKLVEPGHQFEWAWLLARWGTAQKNETALSASRRLQQIGETHGVDGPRGVAMDALFDDLSVLSRQARLWPQTERLKAALALAERAPDDGQRAALEKSALAAARGLSYYLQMQVPGLWRDKMRPDGTFVQESSPASSLYHISCAIGELHRYVS